MDQEKYRLTERVKGQQKALERERELHKDNPNEAMAKDLADHMDSYPFFCETCWEDFTAPAYKTIHRLYGDWIAVLWGEHEKCGQESYRHGTHRDYDPYYSRSDVVNEARNQYAQDTLQADDYGFKSFYGEPWGEHQERMAKKAERIFNVEKDFGFSGKSLKSQERL